MRVKIVYTSEAHKAAAERSKEQLAQSGKLTKPIATVILPKTSFRAAEAYHQKY